MQFQVFFGDYNVLYGRNGVDRSAFKSTSSGIDKPLERSFGSIYKWLQHGFRVDLESHVMTVQAPVNWEVEGELWELMMINSTHDWRKYMEAALERGWPLTLLVQTREKAQHQTQHGEDEATPSTQREAVYVDEHTSEDLVNHNIRPQGLADEGERIHSIVDEMETEGQAAIEMEEYNCSSDDEQYLLPKQ